MDAIPKGDSNLFNNSSDFVYITDNFSGLRNNNIGIDNSSVNTSSGGNSESSSGLGGGSGNFEFFNNFAAGTGKFNKNERLGSGLIILISIEGIKFFF